MEGDVAEGAVPAIAPLARDFDSCYEAHRLWAGRFAFVLTSDIELAEELRQDAFVGLYRNFERVEFPRAYLRASITNLAIRHRGRERRRDDLHRLFADREAVSDRANELFDVLGRLPARQRAVIVLRYYEDQSEAAIAEILHCRAGTVKSLASRALERLKGELEE